MTDRIGATPALRRRTRRRPTFPTAAMLLLIGQGATNPAAADPAARAAFLRRHLCAVTARLDAVHRRGPVTTSRDRFVVVALREEPQRYAQCIFHSLDAVMLCEASSGAYGGASADQRRRLRPEAIAALHALGFRQTDPRGNYARDLPLGHPPRVGLAAELMLTALHDAYGAGADTPIEITAPRGVADPDACRPPTS